MSPLEPLTAAEKQWLQLQVAELATATTFADPGYQADGKPRYPLDSEKHVRAAWSYINMPRNAKKYSSSQLSEIKGKIKSAGKKYDIEYSEASLDACWHANASDLETVGQAKQVRESILLLMAQELTEALDGAYEGACLAALAQALGFLDQFISLESFEATQELLEQTAASLTTVAEDAPELAVADKAQAGMRFKCPGCGATLQLQRQTRFRARTATTHEGTTMPDNDAAAAAPETPVVAAETPAVAEILTPATAEVTLSAAQITAIATQVAAILSEAARPAFLDKNKNDGDEDDKKSDAAAKPEVPAVVTSDRDAPKPAQGATDGLPSPEGSGHKPSAEEVSPTAGEGTDPQALAPLVPTLAAEVPAEADMTTKRDSQNPAVNDGPAAETDKNEKQPNSAKAANDGDEDDKAQAAKPTPAEVSPSAGQGTDPQALAPLIPTLAAKAADKTDKNEDENDKNGGAMAVEQTEGFKHDADHAAEKKVNDAQNPARASRRHFDLSLADEREEWFLDLTARQASQQTLLGMANLHLDGGARPAGLALAQVETPGSGLVEQAEELNLDFLFVRN